MGHTQNFSPSFYMHTVYGNQPVIGRRIFMPYRGSAYATFQERIRLFILPSNYERGALRTKTNMTIRNPIKNFWLAINLFWQLMTGHHLCWFLFSKKRDVTNTFYSFWGKQVLSFAKAYFNHLNANLCTFKWLIFTLIKNSLHRSFLVHAVKTDFVILRG